MRDKTAAVIGGSMAGLLAARALAPYFGKVFLFERDPIEGLTEPRKGAPQAAHVHVLLAAGATVLEQAFPGIFDAVSARGGLHLDMSEQNNWFYFGVWKRRMELGIKVRIQSRLLLEEIVRERTGLGDGLLLVGVRPAREFERPELGSATLQQRS